MVGGVWGVCGGSRGGGNLANDSPTFLPDQKNTHANPSSKKAGQKFIPQMQQFLPPTTNQKGSFTKYTPLYQWWMGGGGKLSPHLNQNLKNNKTILLMMTQI